MPGTGMLNHGFKCKRKQATQGLPMSDRLEEPEDPIFAQNTQADLHIVVSARSVLGQWKDKQKKHSKEDREENKLKREQRKTKRSLCCGYQIEKDTLKNNLKAAPFLRTERMRTALGRMETRHSVSLYGRN